MEQTPEIADFPYDEANFFEDLLMLWVFRLVKYFRKSPPGFHNPIKLPDRIHYSETLKSVKKDWNVEKTKANANILRSLIRNNRTDLILSIVPGCICYNFLVVSSLMVVYIVKYISGTDEPVSHVVGYIIAYFFILQISSLGMNYSLHKTYLLVSKLKSLICQLVYEKTLKTYYGAVSQGDQAGKLSSLISSDVEFLDGLMIIPFFLSTPIFLAGSAVLLWFNLGGAGLVGLAVAIFHLPFIFIFGRLTGKYRFLSAAIGDSRMKMITNLIEGIRIVKLYGWESPYLDALFSKRQAEINQNIKKSLVACINRSINYGSTGLVLFSTFSVYVALGNTIQANTAFSSIAVLILATTLISMIGTAGIMQIFLILTSMKRITQSLLIKEKEPTQHKTCKKHSIKVENCIYTWKEPENQEAGDNSQRNLIKKDDTLWGLGELNFKAKAGELIIVIGAVGSGKSALFMGLLEEMHKYQGEVYVNGKMAIAAEEPWIVSGTIKDNILMGAEFDPVWYNKVVKACCLEKDFDLFKEHRDETMVGDRGITLSGGQKARVSLARAVYSNRSILLLDDPLSAVDPEVCGKLFNDCIKNLLSNKTVILATHQTHFVSQANKVLILDEGKQIFFGTYQEIHEKGLENYLGKISQAKEETKKEVTVIEKEDNLQRVGTKDVKSILVEERAKGTVPLSIYYNYLKLGFKHWLFMIASLLLQVIGQVSYLSVIFWVSYWGSMSDQKNSKYVLGMGILVIILYILTFFRNLSVQIPIIISGKHLHNLALKGIARTESVFFDKNPTGRMLNRFAKDTSQMDEILTSYISESCNAFITITGNFLVMIIISPYVLIVFAALVIYILILLKYIAGTNKELRKLELITKSPILSTLNTSINGLSTLRCFKLEKKFKQEMKDSIELNMKTYIAFQMSLRTLQLYLEIGPNIMSTINIIILVCIKNTIQPGLAGMSISLSVTVMGYVGYLFKTLIETDNYMASPQRLFEYRHLKSEGKLEKNPDFLISNGKIEIVDLYMKYRENYDYALKGLTFTINAGTKTGIIGRTGAGKSSIMQVLFRLVNPQQGFIYIDGQDYMTAGLHDLRKQMSVIPQQAVLFMASLKDNLDPFHNHTDEEIIKVLKKVRLGNLLDTLPQGLNTQINAKGLSLSAGQKQLVCLARAILRKNKIVMMDEATANVDSETDEFIQSQIQKRFKHSTVLIIAHRLRTVIESDWIIVMDQGRTAEEGMPKELIQNNDSALLKMINHTGPEESKFLLSKLA